MLDGQQARLVYPPISDHRKLRQPLTEGEQRVFDFFNRRLDPDWEIYLQPHLNGLRPDIVLLHPRQGIAVFEIKDWNLDALEYYVETYRSGYQELRAKEGNGHSFCVPNPFSQIRKYKNEIFSIYCPRLAKPSGFSAISAGVIFPFANANRVRKLQSFFLRSEKERKNAARYWPIAGEAELASGDLSAFIPNLELGPSPFMSPALAEDFRGWLIEPDFASQQRRPLEMDANQKALSESRTSSGYRRIKGPAGSGKSLVLAARAAALIDKGEHVLVATYNITLWHYLRDLIVRGRKPSPSPGTLTLTHFHKWCKDLCEGSAFEGVYHEIMQPIAAIKKLNLSPKEEAKRLAPILPPILNVKIPALAERAASELKPDFDAILIDEGQDYQPSFWQALRPACKAGGEMILVADATQDVYDTARNWTDEAMVGAGFPGGRWAELKVSYRLPPDFIPFAQEFAREFLPGATTDLPEPDQASLDQLFPCTLEWNQTNVDEEVKACVDAVLAMMRKTGKSNLANADITFLTDNIAIGEAVVKELGTYRVRAAHTFAEKHGEQVARKTAFFMGDARVKATTFHSFKGWESRLLVLNIGNSGDAQSRAAIYAALTRLKRDPEGSFLTVICSDQRLREYGDTWS